MVIDSEPGPGSLDLRELVIEGEQPDEVLLSTYVCATRRWRTTSSPARW
ncbi:MAG: hypothetical protein R2755_02480 [Acidimicrobiales bacterium]